MSVPPDRWRCAHCQANNMPDAGLCFRCHTPRPTYPPLRPPAHHQPQPSSTPPHTPGPPLAGMVQVTAPPVYAPASVAPRRSIWIPLLVTSNMMLLLAAGLLGWDDVRLRTEARARPTTMSGPNGSPPATSGGPGETSPAPASGASTAATPFDAYLEWVRVQEHNRTEMRGSLGQISGIAQQMKSRRAPVTPQDTAAVKKAYTEYHEFLRQAAQRWQANLQQGRSTLSVPAECQEFDREYMAALKDEVAVFEARGNFLLGDTGATDPSELSGRAILLMANANSKLQLLQLGQGRYNGRVRVNLSAMAP